ncbi:MAG: alpha/beta hydrolase [Bacteroidales bacterium]|nr:alpha/beta hydrolase [Bacteroidales bacterium]
MQKQILMVFMFSSYFCFAQEKPVIDSMQVETNKLTERKMKVFRVENLQSYVRYFDTGSGTKNIVFLHGLGSSSIVDFSGLLTDNRFSKYRLILIDLLGFGISDKPSNYSYDLYQQADIVSNLLDELKIEKYSLVGHSMGGVISIALAQKDSKRIEDLILMEPNLDPGIGSGSKIIASQAEDTYVNRGHYIYAQSLKSFCDPKSSLAIYYGTFLLSTPIAIHRSATKLLEGTKPIQREVIKAFTKNKYIIVGELSLGEYPKQELEKLGLKISIISKAGHAMMHDNPLDFKNKLYEILSK